VVIFAVKPKISSAFNTASLVTADHKPCHVRDPVTHHVVAVNSYRFYASPGESIGLTDAPSVRNVDPLYATFRQHGR